MRATDPPVTQPNADLDALIVRLRTAVHAGQRQVVGVTLQKIETILEGLNPLMRGTSYAHVQSVLGRPAQAAEVIESLLQLMPEAAMLHYQLGCYHREAHATEPALAAFSKALELDPALVDASIQSGTVLDTMGEHAQAIEAYRHGVLHAPTEVDVWRNLGNSLAAIDRFDEALQAYGTARQLLSDDDTVGLLIASCHVAKGDLVAGNAAIPPRLRDAVGEFVEVRHGSDDTDLRCRFHATKAQRQAAEDAAHALLNVVAADTNTDTEREHYIVSQGSTRIVCEQDASTPKRAHRFLLCTTLVVSET